MWNKFELRAALLLGVTAALAGCAGDPPPPPIALAPPPVMAAQPPSFAPPAQATVPSQAASYVAIPCPIPADGQPAATPPGAGCFAQVPTGQQPAAAPQVVYAVPSTVYAYPTYAYPAYAYPAYGYPAYAAPYPAYGYPFGGTVVIGGRGRWR